MEKLNSLQLDDGSQIAVMGGGPAGSFFSYFLLDMAERVGIDVQVDIYEPKDFSRPGPPGCNHCGGGRPRVVGANPCHRRDQPAPNGGTTRH